MKAKLGGIKKGFKRVLNVFWQNLFLVLIVLMVIDLGLGALFFYVYYSKAQAEDVEIPLTLTVNRAMMEDVFSKWDEKELQRQQALTREFPELFRKAAPPEASPEATSTPETPTSPEATTTPE